MKKKFFGVLFAMVLALSLVLIPVSASSPQPLVAVGGLPGSQEASIEVVLPPEVTTLGDLLNISWAVYCEEGYSPHLDITLAGVPEGESMLTAEMAYNNDEGVKFPSLEGFIGYDEWLQTFELTTGDGFGAIGDSTLFWVTNMGAGNVDAPSGTLADWKAGKVGFDPLNELSGGTAISASTVITKLEIEVDNWILDTVAYVDNININTSPAVGLLVTTIEAPEIVAVAATPTSIDFGTLYPGQSSVTTVVTVENVGTVTIDVDARVDPAGKVFDNLKLNTFSLDVWSSTGLAGGDTAPVDVQLVVPEAYIPTGPEEATLIFEATAAAQ